MKIKTKTKGALTREKFYENVKKKKEKEKNTKKTKKGRILRKLSKNRFEVNMKPGWTH